MHHVFAILFLLITCSVAELNPDYNTLKLVLEERKEILSSRYESLDNQIDELELLNATDDEVKLLRRMRDDVDEKSLLYEDIPDNPSDFYELDSEKLKSELEINLAYSRTRLKKLEEFEKFGGATPALKELEKTRLAYIAALLDEQECLNEETLPDVCKKESPSTPEPPPTPKPDEDTPEPPPTPKPDEDTPEPPPTPKPDEDTPEPPPTPKPDEDTPEPPPTPKPDEDTPEPPPTPKPDEDTPEPPPTPKPDEDTPEPPPTPKPDEDTPEPPPTPKPDENTPEPPKDEDTPEPPPTPKPDEDTPEPPPTPKPPTADSPAPESDSTPNDSDNEPKSTPLVVSSSDPSLTYLLAIATLLLVLYLMWGNRQAILDFINTQMGGGGSGPNGNTDLEMGSSFPADHPGEVRIINPAPVNESSPPPPAEISMSAPPAAAGGKKLGGIQVPKVTQPARPIIPTPKVQSEEDDWDDDGWGDDQEVLIVNKQPGKKSD